MSASSPESSKVFSQAGKDAQLSQLIHLKKQEKPDEDFWKSFEEELRSKQLAALVGSQTWKARLGRSLLFLGRKTTVFAATAAAFAIAFVALGPKLFVAEEALPEIMPVAPPSIARQQQLEKPIFIVSASELLPEAESQDSAYSVSQVPATYGVKVLPVSSGSEKYEIVSSPMTLKAPVLETRFVSNSQMQRTSFGAKIIRAKED